MSLRVILQPRAKADLKEILAYLGEHRPSAAVRFRAACVGIIRDLPTMPMRGAAAPFDPSGAIRRVIVPQFRSYLVFYRLSESQLTVLRILHSAREATGEFGVPGDL